MIPAPARGRGGNRGERRGGGNRRGNQQRGGNRDGNQRGGNRGGNEQGNRNRGGNQQRGENRVENNADNEEYGQGDGHDYGTRAVRPHQRRNHEKTERKGPAFGFKRLHKFLSSTTDEVIMSIDLDIKDWQEFLESEDLTAKSDTLLILVMQILAEKICCETILVRQQMAILSKTNVTNFIDKINQKSMQICIGVDNGRRMTFNTSDFVEVDTSPKTFLTSLHKYSSYVAKVMSDIAVDYLLSVVASAYGAVSSQSISDQSFAPLVTKFTDLRQEIQSLIKKMVEKPKASMLRDFGFTDQEEQELHAMEAPDDFRSIDIIPTPGELLSKNEVFLRPNKKSGSYNDANHYLDVQFRLLREDFVQPLKKGIQDFMRHRFDYLSKKKKIPLGTIRVYPDVQIISGELVRDVFVYKVQLADESYKKIKWDRSKRLLTGSLLVFTSNFFQTAYFATVANRRPEDLAKGIVSVIWEGSKPTWDTDDEYLLIECEVYFEAYRHTLQTLKDLELQDFPMCKFIVFGSSDVGPPKYLDESEHLIKLGLQNQEDEVYISPLIQGQWPSNDALGLDANQYAAFQAALTKEFAIIQGPPGTGKTFLGLRIAEMFLNNQDIWEGSPILVVCYTNHALDQFLEGLLEIFTKMGDANPSIVRVGGRSQSEKLQHYSLQNVVRRYSKSMPKLYWPTKHEIMAGIDEFRNLRSSAMAAVMGLRDIQGIINFERLDIWDQLCIQFPKAVFTCLSDKVWFGLNDQMFQGRDFKVEEIIQSWFEIRPFPRGKVRKVAPRPKEEPDQQAGKDQDGSDDDFEEDYDVDELQENRIIDDIFAEVESKAPINMGKHLSYIPGYSIKECERAIQESQRVIDKVLKDEKNPTARQQQVRDLEFQKLAAERRKMFLEKLFDLYRSNRIDLPDVSHFMKQIVESPGGLIVASDLKKLSKPMRWAVFFEVVERARVLSAKKASQIDENLIHEQKKLQEIEAFGKGFLLRNSKVVGMTTTGAAKYHELVTMMQSRIVIVEEAAEVLESHIVTCISKKCEHLILIGDHRQLRPSTTVYDLAKKFNLDISLFERMINNKLNCYQLKEQHRMRPEIANLVVGTIYEELNNHPSVSRYPAVKGVTKNLYFISHNELEKSESDSMSKSNVYEAKFLAALCRYLILQGYSADQITVLTTYTGQMFLLKKTFSNFLNCKGVRVTVVDNFQGEENDIILLSLVRSNVESKIGFLSIDNRICVALSRARHGLFIIGNMKMLASRSKTWTQIQEKLDNRGECGPSLILECQIHETLSEVSSDNDFIQKVPEGGCNVPCDTLLKCTHKCQKICHIKDPNHKEYQCQLQCLNKCTNDHPCTQRCFARCPPCHIRMTKTLPCTHNKFMPCFQNVTEIQCMEPVSKKLTCGHDEVVACYRDPTEVKCYVELEKELPCLHKRTLKCHEDPASINCRINVTKILPCGHEQEAECRFAPEHINCRTVIPKKFEKCDHEIQVQCIDFHKPAVCRNQCTIRLPCGHACTRVCHVLDDPEHLTYICKKDCAKVCPEGHKCSSKHKCHLSCRPCKVEIERKLPCAHVVRIKCNVDPIMYECLDVCEKILPCRHKCQSLCFEECGRCQIPVEKRIPECRHTITVPCSVAPSRNDCFELVKPLNQSECKHDTSVPCAISQTATHFEVMQHCLHPCKKVFAESEGGCGHECMGTCNSCIQGRFHEKCQNKCERQLVCGHVCTFPCSNACPPCAQLCGMKCEHSECKNKCGTPCQDCSEKCPWQCPHKRCTKLCREMCDRDPCDEPCQQQLKCGHPCIGFCGELCPPLCRICNSNDLQEQDLFDLNESENDSRYVFLPDCKHSIEVTFLAGWMNVEVEEIGVKRCPLCSTVIRSCRRFGNNIRNRLKDVIKVKTSIFGNQKKIRDSQNTSITKLKWDDDNRWTRTFPALHGKLMDMLTNTIPVRPENAAMGAVRILPKPVDERTLENINLIITYADRAIILLLKAKSELNPDLYADLISRYRDLFKLIIDRKFPLNQLEFRDIGRELDRLQDLNQIYLRRSSPKFTNGNTRATPVYELLKAIVLSHKPYTHKSNQTLINLLKELEDILKTGLGITEKEKREVLQAMGFSQGHWFQCPNGHIYAIGECGGASQVSVCNACGVQIGGSNHQLLRGNTLATEMDGAVGPAWPTAMQY